MSRSTPNHPRCLTEVQAASGGPYGGPAAAQQTRGGSQRRGELSQRLLAPAGWSLEAPRTTPGAWPKSRWPPEAPTGGRRLRSRRGGARTGAVMSRSASPHRHG